MITKTTNVVIIDDDQDEIESLIKMLNHEGIGSVYYSGTDYKEYPTEKLKGVRLLFLDFVLGTDGQKPKTKISVLMGAVKGTIAQDNGPYIILTWTKNSVPADDLLKLFKKAILKDKEFPKPVIVVNLEKNKCMKNPKRIHKELNKKLGNENILKFILSWEKYAQDAVCDVVRRLSNMSRPEIQVGESLKDYSTNWKSQIEKQIFKIAEMSLGKENISANKNLLVVSQLSLTAPFHDCAETLIKRSTKDNRKLTKKIFSHRGTEYDIVEKAAMNTFFLLANQEIDQPIQPGNIYKFKDVFKEIKCKEKTCYYNQMKLGKTKIVQEFFKGSTERYKEYENKLDLRKKAIPVLLEITPECDYVNKKCKTPKLILGILWPESFVPKIQNNANYIYRPFPIKYQNEVYYIAFNAHHLFNLEFSVFKSVKPILKARKELRVDIQQWFSNYIARPGKAQF